MSIFSFLQRLDPWKAINPPLDSTTTYTHCQDWMESARKIEHTLGRKWWGIDGELTRGEKMKYGLDQNILYVCTNFSSNNKTIIK